MRQLCISQGNGRKGQRAVEVRRGLPRKFLAGDGRVKAIHFAWKRELI